MEARRMAAALLAAVFVSLGASYRTQNFVVEAPTSEMAEEIGKAAEHFRHDLAIQWTGEAMPNWHQPCPIHAQVAPNLGAGGATSFVFDHGEVFGWRMEIQGNHDRILDSVLPHEVTHTIFATHFRRPLPRWADEGACTTVEDISERTKQDHLLIQFLHTGRGIAFSNMFVMSEYPKDILPLYAQGYSLARFLIDQKGQREFITYIGEGMSSEDWTGTTYRHYGFASLGELQNSWLDWVKKGSPLHAPSDRDATHVASAAKGAPGSLVVRAQSADRDDPRATAMVPLRMAGGNVAGAPAGMPVRNGSITPDGGADAVALAGPPPQPMPVAVGAAQTAASQVAWQGTGGSETPHVAGKSVYGPGVGLIHHTSEAQSAPADVAPASGTQTTAQRQVLLEWSK